MQLQFQVRRRPHQHNTNICTATTRASVTSVQSVQEAAAFDRYALLAQETELSDDLTVDAKLTADAERLAASIKVSSRNGAAL